MAKINVLETVNDFKDAEEYSHPDKKSVCFYFQVHQPYRMKKYSVFDIGKDHNYFDDSKNTEVLDKVSRKCYLPTNKLMLHLIKKYPEFKVAYSISGVALEQFKQHEPKIIESFQKLTDTGNVEMLGETYHHSLAFIHSKKEFVEQVRLHEKMIGKLFEQNPKVFRNTELIYNNDVGRFAEVMGYKGIIAEGADHVLGWRSPNYNYMPHKAKSIKLLLKNYRLSDDIAFRFSDKGWSEHPLTAPKFASWVGNARGHNINLFMDYETFGEHQWADTGIFSFMAHLPKELMKNGIVFKNPKEVAQMPHIAELDIPHLMSWADIERDLSAWQGNKMQMSALKDIYALETEIHKTRNKKLIEDWRKLQTSDHFYYMCTKWFSDGDVHKYFNPYDSPYDSFVNFMNILNDIKARLKDDESAEARGLKAFETMKKLRRPK